MKGLFFFFFWFHISNQQVWKNVFTKVFHSDAGILKINVASTPALKITVSNKESIASTWIILSVSGLLKYLKHTKHKLLFWFELVTPATSAWISQVEIVLFSWVTSQNGWETMIKSHSAIASPNA